MADYPVAKFRFQVKFDGDEIAHFTEVSGLDSETEIIEFREGGSISKYKQIVLGLNKANRVTLKRGVFQEDAKHNFYKWWNKTTAKQSTAEAQRSVTIILIDEVGEPVITWTLSKAIPVKLQSTDLKSDGNEIAIESLELAHEGLTIQTE